MQFDDSSRDFILFNVCLDLDWVNIWNGIEWNHHHRRRRSRRWKNIRRRREEKSYIKESSFAWESFSYFFTVRFYFILYFFGSHLTHSRWNQNQKKERFDFDLNTETLSRERMKTNKNRLIYLIFFSVERNFISISSFYNIYFPLKLQSIKFFHNYVYRIVCIVGLR